MIEESLSDSDNESRSRGGDSEVVIGESSSLEFYMPCTLAFHSFVDLIEFFLPT